MTCLEFGELAVHESDDRGVRDNAQRLALAVMGIALNPEKWSQALTGMPQPLSFGDYRSHKGKS